MNRYVLVLLVFFGLSSVDLILALDETQEAVIDKLEKEGNDWVVAQLNFRTNGYCETADTYGGFKTNKDRADYCLGVSDGFGVRVRCPARGVANYPGEVYCYPCGANNETKEGGRCVIKDSGRFVG